MTISNQTCRTSAVGTGAEQVIPFLFPIQSSSDLVVIKREIATGAETVLVLNTHYTVTIDDEEEGGTVTTLSPYISSSYEIHIVRITPAQQTLDLTEGGIFSASSIEAALDKLMKLCIENRRAIERCIRLPETDGGDWSEEELKQFTVLPALPNRLSKRLIFDDEGHLSTEDAG
ncbi:MAG TPA: hypothetical protein PLV55_06015 [Anaerohalosphaeraceae bacterium]|nr:hypothetical protein [Anaerohalosphaeraceae bacterium]